MCIRDRFTMESINIPVLGLIENMAYFTPEELPENKYYIFGKQGAQFMAEDLGPVSYTHLDVYKRQW